MSGNKKIILTSTIFALFLSGCALKHEISKPYGRLSSVPEKSDEIDNIKIIKPKIDKKEFEEFSLLLQALYLKYTDPTAKTYDIFYKLYKTTGNPEYLYEAIKNIMRYRPKEIDKALEMVKEGLKTNPDSEKLNNMLVTLYLKKDKFKEALKVTQKLLKKRKTKKYYLYAAISYLGMENFQKAIEYYKKAYELSQDVDILNQMVTILYKFMGKKDEAVKLVKEYIRKKGCDYYVCNRLAEIYIQNGDLENAVDIYKKMYEKYKEKKILKKIVEIYLYLNKPKEAVNYVISTGGNEDVLIEIYISEKNYDKAYEIAKKLYEKTKDPKILAKVAILEYEKAKKKDKKLLNSIVKKFEKAMPSLSPFDQANALFYNYYGYLLIDHDIDVDKGIKYVKKALRLEPSSIYYLDSLAWGYYKEHKCKEAYEIMDKIIDKTDEQEIIDHYNIIKACYKKEDKK